MWAVCVCGSGKPVLYLVVMIFTTWSNHMFVHNYHFTAVKFCINTHSSPTIFEQTCLLPMGALSQDYGSITRGYRNIANAAVLAFVHHAHSGLLPFRLSGLLSFKGRTVVHYCLSNCLLPTDLRVLCCYQHAWALFF